MKPTKEEIEKRIAILRPYATMKLEAGDFHGVRDVCVDLEILNAQLQMLEPESES